MPLRLDVGKSLVILPIIDPLTDRHLVRSMLTARFLRANFAGSFVMGFLSEDQKLFHEDFERSKVHATGHGAEEVGLDTSDPALQPHKDAAQKQAKTKAHSAVKKTIPLYIGLTTG